MRASRSVPFVSKTVQCDFIEVATKAMLGAPITADDNAPDNASPMRPTEYVGVKVCTQRRSLDTNCCVSGPHVLVYSSQGRRSSAQRGDGLYWRGRLFW